MHIVSLELLRTFSVATTMDESGTKHSLEAFEEPMEYIVTFGVGADALAGSRKQNRVTGGVHNLGSVSYTHLTLPTIVEWCRSRWSPYH